MSLKLKRQQNSNVIETKMSPKWLITEAKMSENGFATKTEFLEN